MCSSDLLGNEALAGETVVYSSRDSLTKRRLLRHLRRNRRARRQRIFQLRQWCGKYSLPWADRKDWQSAMERAFALRLAGVEKAGALSAMELVVCLRHILGLRGYDWHRSGESEGTFPWGDKEPLSRECREWMAREYITDQTAQAVRSMLPPDISDEDVQEVDDLLAAAIVRSQTTGMMAHLREHAADPFGKRARNKNFPREVLEEHAEKLIRNHAALFPAGGVDAALGD